MNTRLVVLSLFELALSILLGVVVLYVAYYVLSKVIFKKASENTGNIAYSVIASSILFAVGNLMEGAIDPIANTIRYLSSAYQDTATVAFEALKYVLMFVGISAVLALIINMLAVKLFTSLTKVNELEEIEKNNVAPALITGVITIVISIFAKSPAIQLMEAIIPYPSVPGIL